MSDLKTISDYLISARPNAVDGRLFSCGTSEVKVRGTFVEDGKTILICALTQRFPGFEPVIADPVHFEIKEIGHYEEIS